MMDKANGYRGMNRGECMGCGFPADSFLCSECMSEDSGDVYGGDEAIYSEGIGRKIGFTAGIVEFDCGCMGIPSDCVHDGMTVYNLVATCDDCESGMMPGCIGPVDMDRWTCAVVHLAYGLDRLNESLWADVELSHDYVYELKHGVTAGVCDPLTLAHDSIDVFSDVDLRLVYMDNVAVRNVYGDVE